MQDSAPHLYTVGHSNVSLENFLGLLQQHQIEAVADVRTRPRSRYVPHFDAEPLRSALTQCGLEYVPLGRELGGRPDGDEFYDEKDRVLYGRLATSPAFQQGIDRVLGGAASYRIALLCSEENPARCHRHLLIGRVVRERGVAVSHIRGDGRLETEADLAAQESNSGLHPTLFEGSTAERPWRSTRSVSRRRAPLSSSAP